MKQKHTLASALCTFCALFLFGGTSTSFAQGYTQMLKLQTEAIHPPTILSPGEGEQPLMKVWVYGGKKALWIQNIILKNAYQGVVLSENEHKVFRLYDDTGSLIDARNMDSDGRLRFRAPQYRRLRIPAEGAVALTLKVNKSALGTNQNWKQFQLRLDDEQITGGIYAIFEDDESWVRPPMGGWGIIASEIFTVRNEDNLSTPSVMSNQGQRENLNLTCEEDYYWSDAIKRAFHASSLPPSLSGI